MRLIDFPKGLHFLVNTNAKVFKACMVVGQDSGLEESH